MSLTAFAPPPQPAGTLPQQLMQQYTYLFRMSQQLSAALSQLEGPAVTAAAGAAMAAAGAADDASGQRQKEQYQNLRALVIKSAQTVEKQMDTLTQTLTGSYVAASDFGTYVEKLSAYLEANPEALTQYYSFASDLKAGTDILGKAFNSYVAETEGYIRTGIVAYDGAVPVYGVAVGQGLSAEDVTLSDGTAAVYIHPRQFRSVFTASRLSFYQDDVEVAYLSNNRLYITDAQITGRVFLGGDWQLERSGGLTLKWIGS